jgi:hypothetical protein
LSINNQGPPPVNNETQPPPTVKSKRMTAPPPVDMAKGKLKKVKRTTKSKGAANAIGSTKKLVPTKKIEANRSPPAAPPVTVDAPPATLPVPVTTEKEISNDNSKINEYKNENIQLNKEVNELKEKLIDANAVNKKHEEERQKLESQLEESKQAAQLLLSSAQREKGASKDVMNALEEQLEQTKKELSSMKLALAAETSRVTKLQQQQATNAVVAPSPSSSANNSNAALSDEISRLNFELSLAQRDKEKALALVVDLVGRKRLMKYLDAHGKDEHALKTLKRMVRRGISASSKSPEQREKRRQQNMVVQPRADHGAWWSTRDLDEVPSARRSESSKNTPPSSRGGSSRRGGSGSGGSGSGSGGTRGRKRGKRRGGAQYNELLDMARVQQQRSPFVSMGRRHSTFDSMSQSRNGRVPNGYSSVVQAEREYEEAASNKASEYSDLYNDHYDEYY